MSKFSACLVLLILTISSCYARWDTFARTSENSCGDLGSTPDVYPWNAVLEHDSPDGKYRSMSKGFLVSDRHVLTSVSSVHNAEDNWKLSGVRLGLGVPKFGTTDVTGESFGLESIVIHDTLDLALLKLDMAVNFTETIKPICLPDNDRFDFSSSDSLFTSHCKRFFESETGEPGSLKEKTTVSSPNVTQVDHPVCKELYKRAGSELTFDHICAFDQRGDTCSGDLGGALVTKKRGKHFVVGIGSYLPTTVNLPQNVFPSIYTNVVRNLKWISKNLKETINPITSSEDTLA